MDAVQPQLQLLMRVQLQVATPLLLGNLPSGQRKFVAIGGGEFSGPELKGRIIPGGGDWLLQRADGCIELDARYTLEANDGALIYLQDRGFRHGPEAVMQRLAAGEAVPASAYYFRTCARLETAAPQYQWLNSALVIGSGCRQAAGVAIDFYRVL